MGTSYRKLIFNYAGGVIDGRTLLAFAPSGPSSGYLPASMLDLPLDFKAVADAGSMVGSGRNRGLRGQPLHARHGLEFSSLLP